MDKMDHGKFQVGHKNFTIFTGPQLIEWYTELLLTTSGSQKNFGFKVGQELKKVGDH